MSDGLGTSVARGLGWSFGWQTSSRIWVLLWGIVLARLLTEDCFGVVAVAMAAAGTGAWAIAASRVVGSVVTALLFFMLSPVHVRPGFDRDIARGLLRFGVPIAASALIVEAVLNVDDVVVGRTLGTMTLGLRLFAFNLSSWPVSVASVAMGRVSFAGFSRLVDDRARLVRGLLAAFGIAALATVGLVLVLRVLAPEIVEVINGDKWLPTVLAVSFPLVLGGFGIKASGLPHALLRPLSGATVTLIALLVTLGALEGAVSRLVVGGAVYTLLVLPWNPLGAWLWHQLQGPPTAAGCP